MTPWLAIVRERDSLRRKIADLENQIETIKAEADAYALEAQGFKIRLEAALREKGRGSRE